MIIDPVTGQVAETYRTDFETMITPKIQLKHFCRTLINSRSFRFPGFILASFAASRDTNNAL